MSTVKITELKIENVKRVRAVRIVPNENGLTIIGGGNGEGKTSVLDAIFWALGGNKAKPSNAKNESSVLPPTIRIELSNGLVVERAGKNSDLKVIDPSGNKAGQALLDSLIGELALNLPKFIAASDKEKANTLLQILGIGDKLFELDQEEARLYNQRHGIGQMALQKKKYADELVHIEDAPDEPVSASELLQQHQALLAKNAENMRMRERQKELESKIVIVDKEIEELEQRVKSLKTSRAIIAADIGIGGKKVEQLQDESTAEIEANLAAIDETNAKVRDNQNRDRAISEWSALQEQYDGISVQLDNLREDRMRLLDGADMPLDGLSVEGGELVYNGQRWDGMSSAEQLRVAVAIVRRLRPDCGFVLLDKLEQMDGKTLTEFGQWVAGEGLQVIGTRVSTGDECSIIIEDGMVAGQMPSETPGGSMDREADDDF